MPFTILQIRNGSKILKPSYGCVVGERSTVADIITNFSSSLLELGKEKAIPDEYRSANTEAKVDKTKTNFVQVHESPSAPCVT